MFFEHDTDFAKIAFFWRRGVVAWVQRPCGPPRARMAAGSVLARPPSSPECPKCPKCPAGFSWAPGLAPPGVPGRRLRERRPTRLSDQYFFIPRGKETGVMTIATTFAIGEVQTSPKGAKSAPLKTRGSTSSGSPSGPALSGSPATSIRTKGLGRTSALRRKEIQRCGLLGRTLRSDALTS